MQIEKQTDIEIVLTKTIAAPREQVFRALTDPSQVKQWLQAGPFAMVGCEIDLRVGGAMRYTYRRPNGKTIEVRGRFDRVDPPGELRYAESYDFSPLTLVVTTTLKAANGSTVFTQTLRYKTQADRDADFPNIESTRPAYANLDRFLVAQNSR
jgi:uncharacterized protein YndB with AHSA1/START domain